MRRILGKILLCCAVLAFASPASAYEVAGIPDGDGVDVISPSGKKLRLRIFGIDCPELDQPYGPEARQHLAQLVTMGKPVHFEPQDVDRYRRIVAIVRVEPSARPLEELLLENGLAWVYPKYCTHPLCDSWLALEAEAREAGRGLWQDEDPIPPWEWRTRPK